VTTDPWDILGRSDVEAVASAVCIARKVILRIPTQGGQVFRFDRGHRSDLMVATIPI